MVNESNFEVRSDLWVFFEVTMASEATKIASTRGEINCVICSPPKCPLSEGILLSSWSCLILLSCNSPLSSMAVQLLSYFGVVLFSSHATIL